MANEDGVFLKEVDQALDEDRQEAFFRRYGPALIAGALVVVAAVAGWQIWTHMRTQTAEVQALEFRNALELLEENRDAGRAALEAVSEGQGGYATLAAFRRANSYAAGGERLKARDIYRSIADSDAPARIREFAQLRAAYLSLADGRDEVMADLGRLTDSESPYGYYAREVLGVASLTAEDYEAASATFSALSADLGAPLGVRDRAEEFAVLADLGKAGVNITGEARVEDLLEAIGSDGAADVLPDESATVQDDPGTGAVDTPEGAAADAIEDTAEETGDPEPAAEDDPAGQSNEE